MSSSLTQAVNASGLPRQLTAVLLTLASCAQPSTDPARAGELFYFGTFAEVASFLGISDVEFQARKAAFDSGGVTSPIRIEDDRASRNGQAPVPCYRLSVAGSA